MALLYWGRWAWTAEGTRLHILPCQACWPEGSGAQAKNLATGSMCSWLESRICHDLAPSRYLKMHSFTLVNLEIPGAFFLFLTFLKPFFTCSPPPSPKESNFKPDSEWEKYEMIRSVSSLAPKGLQALEGCLASTCHPLLEAALLSEHRALRAILCLGKTVLNQAL